MNELDFTKYGYQLIDDSWEKHLDGFDLYIIEMKDTFDVWGYLRDKFIDEDWGLSRQMIPNRDAHLVPDIETKLLNALQTLRQ